MADKDVKIIRKELEKIKKSIEEVEKILANLENVKTTDSQIYGGPVSEAP